jgi:hypothetical protein
MFVSLFWSVHAPRAHRKIILRIAVLCITMVLLSEVCSLNRDQIFTWRGADEKWFLCVIHRSNVGENYIFTNRDVILRTCSWIGVDFFITAVFFWKIVCCQIL